MPTSKVPLHPNRQRFKKLKLRPCLKRVKENLRTCDKGREMVMASMRSSEQSMTKLCFGVLKTRAGGGGGGLPYETDGDARRLA